MLFRSPYTSQAFIPFGQGVDENSIEIPGDRYLVIVAENGTNDTADLRTARAFIARADQGIMYNTAVWRKSSLQLRYLLIS